MPVGGVGGGEKYSLVAKLHVLAFIVIRRQKRGLFDGERNETFQGSS